MAELCEFREMAASQSKMIGHSDSIKCAVSADFLPIISNSRSGIVLTGEVGEG
jgi:hypothetical protein